MSANIAYFVLFNQLIDTIMGSLYFHCALASLIFYSVSGILYNCEYNCHVIIMLKNTLLFYIRTDKMCMMQ